VYKDIEKKLQQLSDKFSSNKMSKQDDDRRAYYEEIYKFIANNQLSQVDRAYRVRARLRKRVFKFETTVWELKILSMTEVPVKEITAEIWKRETAFCDRLLITPEIQESIKIIKSKVIDGNFKVEKEEKEAPQFMKALVKSSKTFKFGNQPSQVNILPEGSKGGFLNAGSVTSYKDIDDKVASTKTINKVEVKEEPPKEEKAKKGGLGGKFFGKLIDKTALTPSANIAPVAIDPAPAPADSEKSPKGGIGAKLGLLAKKSTKKTERSDGNSNGASKDALSIKEDAKPVNLLQRINMNNKQIEKQKHDADKAIKDIRRLVVTRKPARVSRERQPESDRGGRRRGLRSRHRPQRQR
jgi:hypothetical protein